jgi:tRNA-dihydrouridine synthase B
MLTHYGVSTGLKIGRKHVAWYSKGLPGSAEFRTRIMQLEEPHQVRDAIHDFYAPQLDRLAA